MAYRALLSRALEDGRIDETEGNALVDMADRWGLALDRVTAIHRSYLSQLVKAAHADRRVTDAEQREIEAVVHMLGLGPFTQEQLHALSQESDGKAAIDAAASPIDDWAGKTVCFTGECCCSIRGEIITREKAEKLAARKGLRVMPTVTKALEILVVADPHTQSNKARKARQYGTRIVHERLFWRTIGVTVD